MLIMTSCNIRIVQTQFVDDDGVYGVNTYPLIMTSSRRGLEGLWSRCPALDAGRFELLGPMVGFTRVVLVLPDGPVGGGRPLGPCGGTVVVAFVLDAVWRPGRGCLAT